MQKALNINENVRKVEYGVSKMFEIMFVHYDEDQTVEVVESPTIDFNAVVENLREGNSVFIAPKIQRPPQKAKRRRHTTNYINHI